MIRLVTKNDIEAVLALSSRAFGENFHSSNYFEKSDLSETSIFVDEKGVVAGYCIIQKEEDAIKVDSITIDETYRGRGIATMLIEDVILNYGHMRIYSHAWKMKNGEVNIKVVLERLGFQFKEEIKNMWYDDSLESGFVCPSCGNPCTCSALVYELTN